MSEGAPMLDAGARARAVGGGYSILLQAPAGSGKTTLLVQRFLRLLSLVDAPEGILALTFTRRAAQEMRQRVIEALRAARLGEKPPHLNSGTWDLALRAAAHLDRQGLDLESQPGRLRIETIDAFNAWLAAQLPIAAGTSGMRVLQDADTCYAEAARRALAHESRDVFGAAVDKVLEFDDQRWRMLVRQIAEMLPSRDRWLPLLAGKLQAAAALDDEQLRELRRHFDEDLQLLVERVLTHAHAALRGEMLGELAALLHRGALRGAGTAPQLDPWRGDGSPLRVGWRDASRWRAMADMLLLADGKGFRQNLKVDQGFPNGSSDKAAMADLLSELNRDPGAAPALREVRALPDPEYSDSQWERVREVAQVLVFAAAQLDAVFREKGAVDFAAISLAALRALGAGEHPSDLALRLDYKLKHILVDEFQDTSGAQLTLLQLLTAGWQADDGRTVFCVGDPMQSIYGFRQAEVRAFLELADEGIGDLEFEVHRLQSNFRSGPKLVEWINTKFAALMPQRDDRDRGAIAFRPSSAVHADPAGAAVIMQPFVSRDQEARGIAEALGAALKDHPGWRIAVLVRARAHARELAAALRARGLPFRAVQIEPLQDRPVVRDLIMLTRALLHFGDRVAWLAVLRAPWAGLSLAELLILARAPMIWDALADEGLQVQLSEAGRARCARLRDTLSQAFAVRAGMPLARWVESTWLKLGGPACTRSAADLEHAERALARLRELDLGGMPDPSELASSFDEFFADQGGDAPIEIMTIHKAKGLEFDMVVVPALERHPAPSRTQLLLPFEFARTGRDGMVMAARPPVGSEGERLFEFLRRQRREAATLESQRLLYVACTRAKTRLLLTAMIEPPETTRPFRPRAGSLLWSLWPAVQNEFMPEGYWRPGGPEAAADDGTAAALGANALGAPAPGAMALRGGPLWRLPADWVPALHTLPVNAAGGASARLEAELWPEFDWAGETARRVGSLVHAELQLLNPETVTTGAIRSRVPYFRRWLAVRGIPPERLEQAAERVAAALSAVTSDARGRWILKAGYLDDFREHAVSGRLEGELVHAVFDRSFVDSGIRWVIDYKTSQHLGGGREEFLDREVVRYTPQLQRYARLAARLGPQPVRVGLYFPLMAAWRDWQPFDD